MRRRYNVGPDGQLRDSDGRTLGRLVSIVLDVSELREEGGVGGEMGLFSKTTSGSSDVEVNQTLEGGVGGGAERTGKTPYSDVTRVWEHYQRTVSSGPRYELNEKRKQVIRDALKVRPLETVLLAIDGLAASPHHNGQNDRRRKYLGIHYALKGIGAQSNDERIDKMAEIATEGRKASGQQANGRPGVMTVKAFCDAHPSGVTEIIREHVRNITQMREAPDHPQHARLGRDSEAALARIWSVELVTETNRPSGSKALAEVRVVGVAPVERSENANEGM